MNNLQIILNSEKNEVFSEWRNTAAGPLIIFSPFLSLASIIPFTEEKFKKSTLIIRGEKQDFVSGVVSLNALHRLIENDWTILVNRKLHLKLFMNNEGSGFLGSANLTLNGLLPYPTGNFESLVFFKRLDEGFLQESIKFMNESIQIDENYLAAIGEWLKDHPQVKDDSLGFPSPKSVGKPPFSLLSIPQTQSLKSLYNSLGHNHFDDCVIHDISLLKIDLDASYEMIKENFRSLELVKSLVSQINGFARFGTLRRWLEDNIMDVPTPSRDDFNTQLNKLYSLIEESFDGEYVIERPNYTHVLVHKPRD